MDGKNNTPPCPWGAPAAGVQWGSPLPAKPDNTSTNSPQHNSTPDGGRTQNFSEDNRSVGSGGGSCTPGAHSFRHQRSSPYQQQPPHSNRMGLPSLGGSTPRHQNRSPHFSPRNFQPRSRYQNSPRFSTPSGNYRPRFDNSQNRSFGPRSDYTPSPRQGFSGGRKSFTPRSGQSSVLDASQYVHPSMLEDPWRDLPAVPLLQTY